MLKIELYDETYQVLDAQMMRERHIKQIHLQPLPHFCIHSIFCLFSARDVYKN